MLEIPDDIDLSEGRWLDKLFDHWVERDGLEYAVNTWRRLHDAYVLTRDNEKLLKIMARERFYTKATYRQLEETYGCPRSKIAKLIKSELEHIAFSYERHRKRLEDMVTTVPEEMAHVLDPRVVVQETCALLMGKGEIMNTLRQLTTLGITKQGETK